MEYQALYRKYRPQRFDEVVGQDHVTHTLSREVIEGKVAHAYLFAGPRGTGKTTTARLLAKALNCRNLRPNGEPCNECPSCIAITEGTALDVIELDAASHNRVEDIREIRVNVGTVAAVGGDHRVYILDEAHMLSRAAGNALLKTLEEPPEHVIFVLATTEPYKLLDTIRSRSQRFDFHPVGTETLIAHLVDIAKREGFEWEPAAIELVANHAKGSVRDAMSLLEQVAALGGGMIQASMVARALGLAERDVYARLAQTIADQDAPGALGLVSDLASRGADLRRFVADAIEFLRGVFLAQYAPNLEEVVDESVGTIEEWRRVAKVLSSADVLRSVDHLSDALTQLRDGREERLVVELALLRLTRPETALDAASLQSRIARLEEQVRTLSVGGVAASSPVEAATPAAIVEAATDDEAPFVSHEPEPVAEEPEAPLPVAADPPLTDLTLEQVAIAWPELFATIREDVGVSRQALLRAAAPAAVEGNTIVLHVPEHLGFHLMRLQQDDDLKARLGKAAGSILGGGVKVDFRPGDVASGVEAPEEPARAPDKDDLEDGAAQSDPADLVADILGGEIVEDGA